jgi:hypothetical protein
VTLPGPNDWRFDEIAADDPKRARLLAAGIEPNELANAIAAALVDAIIRSTVRFGVDCHTQRPNEKRVIVQFPVAQRLYDHFYNGRTGYRAHYWANPNIGNIFDDTLGSLLRQAISVCMPQTAKGRWVVVKAEHGLRWESGRWSL